ncbi:MAG: hypothetical protein IIC78_00320 [Chloroflexi bacterium]|nr:hypothetical protein [Chloroflexota bacterium]
MNYHELEGADPLDATIGRMLKNWISSVSQPGEGEKQRLLRTAASLGGDPTAIWKAIRLLPVLLHWLVDNVLIGPADQPLTYSLSTEFATSRSSNLMILMAKQDILQRLSLQMGVA